MAKQQVAKQKRRKKRWFPILAPQIFNNKIIGETLIYDPEEMEHKHIHANMMTITGDMKRQHTNITFEVVKIVDGKGETRINGAYILPTSVKRLIRKGRNKVEDSIIVKTVDEKYVRIKPLIITNSNTYKLVTSKIRLTNRKLLLNLISKMRYDDLIKDIFSLKLQKYLREALSRIYPIKTLEIRVFELMKKEPKEFSFTPEDISALLPKKKERKKKEPELESKPKADSSQQEKKETPENTEKKEEKPAEKKEASEKPEKETKSAEDNKKEESKE